MRIATWNVNSLKQRMPRFLPWVDERQPDVVCLQETKLADDALAELLGDELATAVQDRRPRRDGVERGRDPVTVGLDDVTTGLAGAPASRTPRHAPWPRRATASATTSAT